MDITKTIFGLTKNNNGFFKSQKQADFIKDVLNKREGYIHLGNSWGTQTGAFVEYDEEGITKVQTYTQNGPGRIIFMRTVEGQLNDLQIKNIKKIERSIKKLQKRLETRQEQFHSGEYNGSGDVSTYTTDVINTYHKAIDKLETSIENYYKQIQKIKG